MLKNYEALLSSVASQPEIELEALKESFAQEDNRQQSVKEKDLEVMDRESLKRSKRRPIREAAIAG
jgi:hypothetical protein